MNKADFISISQKYGLTIVDKPDYEIGAYLPMAIPTKDDCFASLKNDGEVNTYMGFDLVYLTGSGYRVTFTHVYDTETPDRKEYEHILKKVMEQYIKIIPILKNELVNKKIEDIKRDFI